MASPTAATRPGTRRRETIESNPFSAGGLGSPTATTRFSRDDQSTWFSRKSGDAKDGEAEDFADQPSGRPPLGNLLRSNTAGSANLGSMWPPSNPTTPSAGGFGNFSMASSAAAAAVGDKRAVGTGGGSRLAHLIPKDAGESHSASISDVQNAAPGQSSWRSRPRTDTDPFGDTELSGSAILGGSQDMAIGGRGGTLGTPVKGSADDFGMAGLNMGDKSLENDPDSPSETNPYRSPPTDRYDHGDSSGNVDKSHHNPDQSSAFGTLPRAFGGAGLEGSDRSQTSSVGAKAYPLGALSGWPAPGPSAGTPDRERANFGNAFGSSLFGNMGDLQSPAIGNLSNVFGPGAAALGTGSIGRGSKLGSLFPAAMQAQMQSHEHDAGAAEGAEGRQNNLLGAIGRGAFPAPSRDTESPLRSNRGVFEELFPSGDAARAHGGFPGGDLPGNVPQSYTPVSGNLPFGGHTGGGGGGDSGSAQVRQMVMPDRMRWVYLDPQGQVQGPFTGLEMNDWYKANFFTPDLRVKKVEDTEFEPLGQLIRRIGNSREPFLVPQIGVPHGPPSQNGPFNGAAGVIPPLSGVFPSFGRTLTAEEQNNLERRKQEEQYMMAQQRDYMMRAQAAARFGPGLQHHSSAQSLQSQPSFGSMTNPIGMPPQPPAMGAVGPGAFGEPGMPPHAGGRPGAGNGEMFRHDELANLSGQERQMLGFEDGDRMPPHQPVGPPTEASLRAGLPNTGELSHDADGFKERLQEFEGLREQLDAENEAAGHIVAGHDIPTQAPIHASTEQQAAPVKSTKSSKKMSEDEAALSLTQQVQIAQAAAAAVPLEPGMPMPFPPPSSTTPLPAPTAQRARSNLPEQYSRSQSATPDVQPPPMAPWAKDMGSDGPKGPSLKEIQEAEARKAAKAEEAAAAMRKAVMEQEGALIRERERAAAAAASAAALPASSTWGHGSPASATTPWAKPGATKANTSGTPVSISSKGKTLAEIQREEEVRKQKARDVAIQSGTPIAASKSYANLAGKPGHAGIPSTASPASAAAAAAAPTGAGWATVGAGGKVKSPVAASVPVRTTSIGNVKPSQSAPIIKTTPKPVVIAAAPQNATNAALDEFNKWTHRELSRGITGIADITGFQGALNELPLDTGVIADAVYANSTTMDGRHFAEEYVRRKRLAEKGVVEKHSSTDTRASSGGWSEVAKKGGNSGQFARETESPAAIPSPAFRVVSSKKKGKK